MKKWGVKKTVFLIKTHLNIYFFKYGFDVYNTLFPEKYQRVKRFNTYFVRCNMYIFLKLTNFKFIFRFISILIFFFLNSYLIIKQLINP